MGARDLVAIGIGSPHPPSPAKAGFGGQVKRNAGATWLRGTAEPGFRPRAPKEARGLHPGYDLIPCRLWEASLTVKNTTSASGVAPPECTTFDGT